MCEVLLENHDWSLHLNIMKRGSIVDFGKYIIARMLYIRCICIYIN